MKKLLLLSLSLVLILLVGCQLSGTVDVPSDSISVTALSETSKLVDAGDEVTVYFGFSASEYITQNDVNIIVKNSAGIDVTSDFDVDISHFSEMSSTAASKNCYFTITVDSLCNDGTYTVDLDITVGVKKDSKSFMLNVGGISDSISITSLSETSKLVDAGDEVTVYFGFSASEYITQNDVNIIVKNSAGVDVTSDFDVEVSHFSETSSTVAAQKCYYTITVDQFCDDGTYTVDLDITVGVKKDSKSFTLYVGVIPTVSIGTIETASIVFGAIKTDTIKATVLNGLFLSKDDFTVTVDETGGKPTIEILSYVNGVLSMEVSASSAPIGLFDCTLAIFAHGVSKGFTLSVVDVNPVQIVSVVNIRVNQGSSATTDATIANGNGLTAGDFKIVVAGSGSSSSTLVAPTAYVTTFSNGFAKIFVDASKADAGSYNATLSVGESKKNFLILVEGINDFAEISANKSSLTFMAGKEDTLSITAKASCTVTEDDIYYSVFSGADDISLTSGISVAVESFSATHATVDVIISSSAAFTDPGNYTLKLYLNNGEAEDSVSVDLTVESAGTPATITSVSNVSVWTGSSTVTSAYINANGNTLTTSDFSVSIANDIGGTAPNATVSAYSNERATISIDATNATPGTYTGTLTLGSDTENFTVTVESAGTVLSEKIVKLYNPYAKDGYNSAFNMVAGDPVAGDLAVDNIHMVYAAGDSAVADIAVDNSLDIRATNVVAELTSINGGKFVNISKAEYDAATTDIEVKALAATKYFTDNEVIVTDDDDITVDGYFVMKLANNRGFAVVKMTELNKMDTEGSSGNTGYLAIAYKFTAM